MNSQQGTKRKRAGKRTSRQRANKVNKSEEYYNNIVVNIESPTPASVVKLTSESLHNIKLLNQKVPGVQKRKKQKQPQATAVPAQKTALQLELERKFNEVVNKHKALQMHTSRNNPIDFTADVSVPGQMPQQTQQTQPIATIANWNANKKGKNKKKPAPQISKPVVYHHGQPSQFQAPHQNEPEDLTDDLAPHMTGQGVQQQSGSQPGMATSENKLNFKFQRTAQKPADWSEYQNKFRRIGGSPDNEGDAPIKQENDKDQSINAGSSDENRLVSIPPIAGPSSQPKVTPQAVVAPRVEVKPAEKPKQAETTARPLSRFDQKSQYFPPGYVNPYEAYPKGIPRSFLKQQENQRMYEAAKSSPLSNPEAEYRSQAAAVTDLPSWIMPGQAPPMPTNQHNIYEDLTNVGANTPAFVQHEPASARAYSPSDVYSETGRGEDEPREGSESPELQSGQKRLSAFKRLGPLTQPKKPKLTINLMLNKEQAVREVVDETDEASLRYVPVHLRRDIIQSEDEIVKKYLPFWPWKKNMVLRKTASARFSKGSKERKRKTAMMLEQEQMETGYEKENVFIQVAIKGYPKTWSKEDVLDAVLECVKGKTFIPLFIEFTQQECKFLVIRCRAALVAIHKVGFCIRKDDVELTVTISLTDTSLNQIDLIPRLVLRKRLMSHYDGEKSLDLKEFLQKDAIHFVYFPLNRLTNQMELIMLMSASELEYITELNISHNRITNLDGFNLCKNTPRLKHLDLSYNYLDKLTILLPLKDLPLRSLKLEGNPLCHDYIDSAHYVKVVKMIFSEVMELDGIRIPLKGEFLPMKRNYSPEAAVPIVEKFLETFFPLLEAPYEDRATIEDMYDKEAVMTITFRNKLRYGTAYRYFRNLFLRSRCLEEGDMESVKGAAPIGSLINKWPAIQHDKYTITVDVMDHSDSTTILRVGGVLKVIAESLADDEHLLQFTRNIVLHTRNGVEYKIHNEMLYWDVPCEQVLETAFNITTVRPRPLSLKLESPPDREMRFKLIEIFSKVADIGRKRGSRCLALKNWDLRSALEYYVSLLKHGDFSTISFKNPLPPFQPDS